MQVIDHEPASLGVAGSQSLCKNRNVDPELCTRVMEAIQAHRAVQG